MIGIDLVNKINANAPIGKVPNGALAAAIIAESNDRVTDNQKSLIRNILGKELSCLNTPSTNRRIIQTNAVGVIFQVLDEAEDLLNQHDSDDAPACLLRILRRAKKELLRCDL